MISFKMATKGGTCSGTEVMSRKDSKRERQDGDGPNSVNTDDNDEGSSSEETEEEIEPKLRYERLANDLPEILQNDAASCIAVHSKFFALGTHWGIVYILDHHGNNIRNKELSLHTTTVNQISIDLNGDYIATCSNDGKVVIHGLYSSDCNQILSFDRPVRSVILDPLFCKSGSKRRFVTAENKILLHEKGLFSYYKTSVLYQSEGMVQTICWKGQFLAWATDKSVRVFDIIALQTISVIQRDHDPTLRTELYRCNLFWKDANTLLIGWGDNVKLCVVRKRGTISDTSTQTPNFLIEIISIFTIDSYICGIAPFHEAGENNIVCLTIPKDNENTDTHCKPQLQVLEPHGESCSEISSDTLTIRGYTEYRCSDYFLDSLPEEGIYIIVSPKDVVVAKPRDENDHIDWLLEHQKFEEALKAAMESKNLERYTILDVGKMCLENLFEQQLYHQAAAVCSRIFGNDKQLWESEVYKLAYIQQSRAIAPYLPTDENPLDPKIYEIVLNEFLQYDSKGFLKLLREWPCNLYDISTIINAIIYQLELEPANIELLQSLSELYIYEKKYEKALSIYLEIGNKDRVFSLIRDHSLFRAIYDKLEQLMELNCEEATQMLLENTDKIPVDIVVSRLKNKPILLYKYLDRLFLKDKEMGEHHGMLVELYAEHAPDRLLPFLRTSNNYPLEEALQICEQRNLIPEVVFLLGRMGNTKQALQQITEQLQDINQAIEFCKDHDDKELWEDLINYSLDKPEFIRVMLQNIGTHVDPIILINRIPERLEIKGLRDSLVKILQDYYLQISLREGCKKILVSDCYSLLERLNKQQKRGIQINENQVCQACHRKLLVTDARYAEDILVFHCKHVFHECCLMSSGIETCSICIAQKQKPGGIHIT